MQQHMARLNTSFFYDHTFARNNEALSIECGYGLTEIRRIYFNES